MELFERKIYDFFVEWKDRPTRKPLVIRGARQVGKTSAVLMFGKRYFEDVVHINLEDIDHVRYFRGELSLSDFERIIEINFKKKLVPGKCLVFIDEIQNSPMLIKLLRFIHEKKPGLHVMAAGSLLQVKVEKEGFGFPVGRVEFAYMWPLDFFEYLQANRDTELLDYLRSVTLNESIPDGIHDAAMRLFHEYVMVGGMPEAVHFKVGTGDMNGLRRIYSSLFTGYLEDVYKYASQADVKYLSHVIEKAPLFAGFAVTYEKFGGSNFRSREMSNAFRTLEKVMLLYQVQATKSRELPLISQGKRPRKLLFLDVGLVSHEMGVAPGSQVLDDLNEAFRGRIAEQVVGQNILARFSGDYPKLYYWSKDKSEGSAEIDFCFSIGGNVVGVEVKSGRSGRLKSFISFAGYVKKHRLVRIYSGNLKQEKIKFMGKKFDLLSLPFYLIPRILELSA